jgi:hypothetical protein
MRLIIGTGDPKAGRVVMGPKKLGAGYARIVSRKDGSGQIESFNLASRRWSEATDNVSFADVWSAPAAPADMMLELLSAPA